ncbi:MAG: deoxyribodipyrimidine photo-lyase, partial [Verrucomicrobiota bacterium]
MVEIVWLKKDLRVADHEALWRAAGTGNGVVVVFVYEREVMEAGDFSGRHFLFQEECLREVDEELRKLGGELVTRVGVVEEVFEGLRGELGEVRLWSHEETGNGVTYARDLRVKAWAEEREVDWVECLQTGVVRRLEERDGWSGRWAKRMGREVLGLPEGVRFVEVKGEGILEKERFGIE